MRYQFSAMLATALLLSGTTCFGASPSAAKTPEYHEASKAIDAGDLKKAYDLLVPLWEKTRAFDVAMSLGQIELHQGQYRDAAEHLEFGIRNTPSAKSELATKLKPSLAQAKARVVTLKISVDQADADVSIDGKSVGKAPFESDVFVEPGQHKLQATHPTMGSAEQMIDGKAGESRAVELKVTTATTPTLSYAAADLDGKKPQVPVNEPPVMEKRGGIQPKTIVLVVGGAVTLAAGVTTLVFALKGKGERDDAKKALNGAVDDFGPNPCGGGFADASGICSTIKTDLKDSNRSNRIATGFLIGTGVAAIGTVATYLLWPSSSKKSSQLTVVPVAAIGQGGLVLSGSF